MSESEAVEASAESAEASAETQEDAPSALVVDDDTPGARWFVVQTYANFENHVRDAIQERAKAQAMEARIVRVEVPEEEVMEMRRGSRAVAKRKFFPGYVLMRAVMDPQVRHLVESVPKVTGFLGAMPARRGVAVRDDAEPMPMADEEVAKIFRQVEEGVQRPKPSVTFAMGEQVRVAGGPFASFMGTVEEVDVDRARLKVSVLIFGRATPVDLEYGQVEKV